MSKIVIGIDPDSKKYGLAGFLDGKISWLDSFDTVELVEWLGIVKEKYGTLHDVTFVIEDVKANPFIYSRNQKNSHAIAGNIAQKIGACKHSQTVAEQFIEKHGFKLIKQRPIKGNWAKNKTEFERVTGWTGRSNEDTRSAAYMAFLYCKGFKVNYEF